MGDVIIIAISAACGLITLIISKIRCRFVQQTNQEGWVTDTWAMGFTDQPLIDSNPQQIDTHDGNVLVFRR